MREAQTVVDEFVARLRAAAPQKDDLLASGCPVRFAEEVIDRYVCRPKNHDIANAPSDAMLLLHYMYDLSTVSIGGLTFEEDYIVIFRERLAYTSRIPVVILEVDPIALSVPGGEIVQVDHMDPERVMARWASSSEGFLKACALLAEYRAPHGQKRFDAPYWTPTEKELHENNTCASAWALKCARAAGINDFESEVYEGIIWTYP